MGSVSLAASLPGHRNETMSLDAYTQNIPLTQKARFWSNYVSALKGSQDLRAPEEPTLRTWHPSIIETLPSEFPTSSTSSANWSPRCSTVPAGVEQTHCPQSCRMHVTESSALVTRTVQCTQRSTGRTEPGPSGLEQGCPLVYLSM